MNNAPGTITGSILHQQSINNLNLRTFYPSVEVLINGNVTNTFNKLCGRNKARTCDLMGMNHASYLLLYPAIFSDAHAFTSLKYHLFH